MTLRLEMFEYFEGLKPAEPAVSTGTWTPSSPRHVHMDSVNMRHVLRWLPLQDNCSTTVLYSVQFQG